MDLKKRAEVVVEELKKIYGEPKSALEYNSVFELLVAVILSAQCTDKRVNVVTGEMYKKYNKPEDFAEMEIEKLEELIRTTGFYRNKAKNIKAASQIILEKYDGEVPATLEELIELPGVGRKTANVVLGHIYDRPGVVVDTHVRRLSNRIGFTDKQDPVKIEFEMMDIVNQKDWFLYSSVLILHGRNVCKARKPDCKNCTIKKYCDYGRDIND